VVHFQHINLCHHPLGSIVVVPGAPDTLTLWTLDTNSLSKLALQSFWTFCGHQIHCGPIMLRNRPNTVLPELSLWFTDDSSTTAMEQEGFNPIKKVFGLECLEFGFSSMISSHPTIWKSPVLVYVSDHNLKQQWMAAQWA
jgi:hypothetical protein